MTIISLRQVGLHAAVRLFQNLTFSIGASDRIGLVASNGRGKSSLLRCVAGLAQPTEGSISKPRGLRLAYVEQTMPPELHELTLADAVLSALPLEERSTGRWRADIALDDWETPHVHRDQLIRHLSGGWQRLALIARAWVMEPDALLLDEPTNHLDMRHLEMLEGWLLSPLRRVPMIIASHDRRFLDSCTTQTLFLRPETSKIYSHPFSQARALLAEDDAADASHLDRDIKEADRLRRSAAELKNIGINSRSDAAQKKSKQMAQRAETLERGFYAVHQERTPDLRLNSRNTHARVLLSCDDIVVHAPNGHALFRTGKLKIFQGERVVLLGANGVGKSQFIALIRRAILAGGAAEGIQCHPTIVLGYADQHMSQLPDDDTPFGFIAAPYGLGDQRSRTLLAGAGFPVAQQSRQIRVFSPGQKARLGMLALRLSMPNFYLFDEPTNHLDIAGQEKLEAEILAQQATCLVVSHDRHFVQSIGTRFLRIDKGRLNACDD